MPNPGTVFGTAVVGLFLEELGEGGRFPSVNFAAKEFWPETFLRSVLIIRLCALGLLRAGWWEKDRASCSLLWQVEGRPAGRSLKIQL